MLNTTTVLNSLTPRGSDERDDINATDWEIALTGGAAGARGVGGGIMFFHFRSAQARIDELFFFEFGGFGAGGNLISVNPWELEGIQYGTPERVVDGGFSVNALHRAPGALAFAAAGASVPVVGGASYGFVNANATYYGTELFLNKSWGPSVGSGSGLGLMGGVWGSYRKNYGLSPIRIFVESATQGYEDARKAVQNSRPWKKLEDFVNDMERSVKNAYGAP